MAPIGKKSTPSNGGKSSALLKRLTSKKIPVGGLLEVASRKDLAVAGLLEVASRKDLAVAGLLEVSSRKDLAVAGLLEVASRKDPAVAASEGCTAVPATTLVGVSSIRLCSTVCTVCVALGTIVGTLV
jgi:hypothetical protein